MTSGTRHYDDTLLEILKEPLEAVAYLDVASQEEDEEGFLLALRTVAEVHGITAKSKDTNELSLLRKFFYCWGLAESTRGCYSCSTQHDVRCPAFHSRGECVCYRDDLNKLEKEITELKT